MNETVDKLFNFLFFFQPELIEQNHFLKEGGDDDDGS